METGFMNRIIGLVLALVVGGLLVGGLLIPSIEAMTATEKTLHNDTGDELGQLIVVDESTEYTFTWDVTTPGVATINNENVNLYGGTVICGGDPDFIIRYWDGSTKYIQGRDGINDHNFTANSTCSITISGGSATIVADGTTYTYTVTTGFALAKSGTYVMKSSTQAAYMLVDSDFNAYGVSGTDGSTIWIKISGTIEDGASVEHISGQAGTFSDVELHYTTVSGYIGVYALEKLTLTFTNTNTSVDTALTYNYFIVPAAITAELSQHMDATQIAMFGVISILGIVALVVVAANGIRNKY